MKNLLILAFSFFLMVQPVAGQGSLGGTLADMPKIYAVGVGSVTAFPNAAQITIALKFTKPTLREAVNENQKIAGEVQTIIKKYVKDPAEIRSSLISTNKVSRYDYGLKKEVAAGYESNQRLIFTLNDLAAMQDFTEEVLKVKIHEIESISYFHTDAATFSKKAQELAVADAVETTERLAKAANIKLGKILYMETSSSPAEAMNNTVSTQSFQTFNKGMGGRGVSSSGQIITYSAQVTVYTGID